jgi:transcriptional regulator with XRE-family HTH domain
MAVMDTSASPAPVPTRHNAPTAATPRRSFGDHLRYWRQRKRLSQLDLADEAGISTRHLSFVETGRAGPSREMVLRLTERLEVPLRERNTILAAAGFAPMYRERPLDDPEMASARAAVQLILESHEPWPALAMDRHWNMVMANRMVPLLLTGVAPELMAAPVNVLRLSLHPGGLAPRIANLNQWRHHLFERLRQQVQLTGDATLAALLNELQAMPGPDTNDEVVVPGEHPGVLMPFLYKSDAGLLTLVSTVTVFGFASRHHPSGAGPGDLFSRRRLHPPGAAATGEHAALMQAFRPASCPRFPPHDHHCSRSPPHHRICPLCEACCGLEIKTDADKIISIRGHDADVFSAGYICPKGVALKDLHEDPDRLRTPLIKRDGQFVAATWDEAFAEIEQRLPPLLAAHGRDAVALSVGNPTAHKIGLLLYFSHLAKALRSRNVFSASTLDQMPKQLSSGLMFGHWLSIAVPDIVRCDFLLVLGANPLASNGSLWTVPDFKGKAKAMQARGGQLVVVDPRRTETAHMANAHHFIRPGADVFLLLGMVHTLFEEQLVQLGRVAPWVNGLEDVQAAVQPFAPEAVAERCGMAASIIRALARQLATTPRAAVYGRIGTCTQLYGTLASWLVDVLNTLTGHLDAPGGAMFPKAAAFAHNTMGTARTRAWRGHRPPPQPRERCARSVWRAAHGLSG